jgi:hypothetical protein
MFYLSFSFYGFSNLLPESLLHPAETSYIEVATSTVLFPTSILRPRIKFINRICFVLAVLSAVSGLQVADNTLTKGNLVILTNLSSQNFYYDAY